MFFAATEIICEEAVLKNIEEHQGDPRPLYTVQGASSRPRSTVPENKANRTNTKKLVGLALLLFAAKEIGKFTNFVSEESTENGNINGILGRAESAKNSLINAIASQMLKEEEKHMGGSEKVNLKENWDEAEDGMLKGPFMTKLKGRKIREKWYEEQYHYTPKLKTVDGEYFKQIRNEHSKKEIGKKESEVYGVSIEQPIPTNVNVQISQEQVLGDNIYRNSNYMKKIQLQKMR